MRKNNTRYCRNCATYTKHLFIGKPEFDSGDKFMIVCGVVLTGGLLLPFLPFLDERPKFWECSNCHQIIKSSK